MSTSAARRTDRVKPTTPSRVHVTVVTAASVQIAWRAAHDNVKVAHYEVLRDGRRIGRATHRAYTDGHVVANHSYRYQVRAVDAAGNRGKLSRAIVVRTPPVLAKGGVGGGTPGPSTGSGGADGTGSTSGGVPVVTPPTPPVTPPATLTQAMVDRLYWRAGFGPSDAERQTWTGKPVTDLVDFFLESPQQLDSSVPPPLTQSNQPIDPTVSRDELTMEWLYQMQRAQNPFIERLTFFLHRHWVVSTVSGEIPNSLILTYRDRLRSFADLPSNPGSSWRELARQMSVQDGAMSLFLNGWQNTKGEPNENYAREFMELFNLGVVDAQGNPNYTQADVTQLARAFTGWRLNQNPGPSFGVVTFGGNSYFDAGQKTIFGQTANFGSDPAQGAGTASAIDLVLAHPAHAPFVVRSLWSEFIVTQIPDDTLADLVQTYSGDGTFRLKPLLRKILTHDLIFESLAEPNMIKPPVMFYVGAQRALKTPMKWFWAREVLEDMQQCVYEAPNVAGWEGGLSWLNTNTAAARFDAMRRILHLTFNTNGYPGQSPAADMPGETASAAFTRAYAMCGSPWLSDGTRSQLASFAAAQPAGTSTQRLARLYALIALILGGPDGQVM